VSKKVKAAKPKPKANAQPAKVTAKHGPPLRVDSTLQLAWGLTMNFSHEAKENEVGKTYLDFLKALRDNYKDDSTAKEYLDNLSTLLSSYLRTTAFERDVIIGYLDTYKNRRDATVKDINDVSNLASFSSGSFISKVGVFLGFGSLASILDTLTKFATPTQGLPFNLSVVLFGGVAGLVLTLFGFRLFRGRLIQKAETECYEKQMALWMFKARQVFIDELCHLRERLILLVTKYYPNYHEDILDTNVGDELQNFFNVILPEEELYKVAEGDLMEKLNMYKAKIEKQAKDEQENTQQPSKV
jgi:hypothetical protein